MKLNHFLKLAVIGTSLVSFSAASANDTRALNPQNAQSLQTYILQDSEAHAIFLQAKKRADKKLNDKPNPIAIIQSEGLLATDKKKLRTQESLKDIKKIEDFTQAYLLTKDPRYLKKAEEFILAWATINKTVDNSINETKLENLIASYALIKEDMTHKNQKDIDKWLTEKALILVNGKQRKTVNNWEGHRLLITGLIADATSNQSLWDQTIARYKQYLPKGIEPDGSTSDFNLTHALHYHLYAITPLTTLACTAQKSGINLFDLQTHDGRSLRNAVDFVIPYAVGKKLNVEFSDPSNLSQFNKKRIATGEYKQETWNPNKGIPLFSQAACIDPKYRDLIQQIPTNQKKSNKYHDYRSVISSHQYN